jgi:hypothetical protein
VIYDFQCNGSTTINGKRRGRKPRNRGNQQKNHTDIKITRKSLRSSHRFAEISASLLASSDHTNDNSDQGTTVGEGETFSNKHVTEQLRDVHSSQRTGHSPCRANENSPAEDLHTSRNESHLKCSSEFTDSEPKEACDVNSDSKVQPVMAEDKNSFIAEQSACVNVKSMPSYQTENVGKDNNKVIKVSKTRRPLYNPHWLEPNPDDFQLVADTVEGVRQLLTKYSVEGSMAMSKQSCNKVRCCHMAFKLLLFLHCLRLFIPVGT